MLINLQGWIDGDLVITADPELAVFLRYGDNGSRPVTVVDFLQNACLLQTIDLLPHSILNGKMNVAGLEKLWRGITLQLQLGSDTLCCAKFILKEILVTLQ